MPMVRVEHDYRFEGPDGRGRCSSCSTGAASSSSIGSSSRRASAAADAGCVGCSSFADGIPDLGLLHARDITFAMASPAPQANLRRYAERMGWTDVPWYTIGTERFSADFGVAEWFGLNVFLRDGDDVYRTYFLQHGRWSRRSAASGACFPSRRTAASRRRGRPDGWPQAPPSFWYRRHDEYDDRPRQPPAAIRTTSGRRLRSRVLRAGRRSAS